MRKHGRPLGAPPRRALSRRAAGAPLLLVNLLLASGSGAVLAWSPRAHAAEPAEGAAVIFVVESPSELDVERLRAAISREIGAPVLLAAAAPVGQQRTLTLRADEGRPILLAYRAEDGRIVEREIELPDDPERAVEVLALLAGNLVRDEAGELAASLRKHPSRPASPPPSPAAAPARRPAPELRPCAREGTTHVFTGVDVLPFVGSSMAVDPSVSVRHLSFNLFGGYTAGLDGVEIGGLVNIESAFTCGAQFAGIANIGWGPVRGAQIAGIVNVGRTLRGAQAGVINVAAGEVHGAQAGFVNVAAGEVKGVQTSFVNVASGSVLGAQAGFIDVAAGDVDGAQVGFVGVATGALHGVQAGFLNVATGDVRGLQVGFANYAGGNVEGAQIGLVNVANRSNYALGLINIIRDGRTHLDIWGQESGLVMVGVKHGGDHIHNIYGVGLRPIGDHGRFAFTLGIGGHFPLTDRLFLDVDVLGYSLLDPSAWTRGTQITQARLLFGARIMKGLAIFAGPSYDVSIAPKDIDADVSPYGENFVVKDADRLVRGWPGATLGLQAF